MESHNGNSVLEQATSHLPADDDSGELLDMSDLKIIVENKAFPVHSQLLATYSGFFRHLLYDLQHPIASSAGLAAHSRGSSNGAANNSGRMQSNTQQSHIGPDAGRDQTLYIRDVAAKDFAFLLKYLYTQDVSMMEKVSAGLRMHA